MECNCWVGGCTSRLWTYMYTHCMPDQQDIRQLLSTKITSLLILFLCLSFCAHSIPLSLLCSFHSFISLSLCSFHSFICAHSIPLSLLYSFHSFLPFLHLSCAHSIPFLFSLSPDQKLGRTCPVELLKPSPDDLFTVCFTSGTTGRLLDVCTYLLGVVPA